MHKAPSAPVLLYVEPGRVPGPGEFDPLGQAHVVVVVGADGAAVADCAQDVTERVGCRTAGFVTSRASDGAAEELREFCVEQFGAAPTQIPGR